MNRAARIAGAAHGGQILLSEEAARRAWEEGRAMSMDQAVALARQEPGF